MNQPIESDGIFGVVFFFVSRVEFKFTLFMLIWEIIGVRVRFVFVFRFYHH